MQNLTYLAQAYENPYTSDCLGGGFDCIIGFAPIDVDVTNLVLKPGGHHAFSTAYERDPQ